MLLINLSIFYLVPQEINHDVNQETDSSVNQDNLKSPLTKDEMLKEQESLLMELLWIQEAINSRKVFLKYRKNLLINE